METITNTKGNEIKIFATTLEESARRQIVDLANNEAYLDSKIRIMPDAHAGNGCTIGTTMVLDGKVTPNLVGVDIGCGMLAVVISAPEEIDFKKLDSVIKERVPSGFNVRAEAVMDFDFSDLRCREGVDLERAALSLGTLGGGNHFIEIGEFDGSKFLIIHTGSRKLGKDVCKYYQKKVGRKGYLEGQDFEDYINDMEIVQNYARWNRRIIANEILAGMEWGWIEDFETIHNYISLCGSELILRKGAVSALSGEPLIIPMNMRDGSLLCVGKGNEDWNFSAPHGAGRVMSRGEAKRRVGLEEFKASMSGIYSTCIGESTLDESPMAYKGMEEIVEAIKDTVYIKGVIKSIYNFKAS